MRWAWTASIPAAPSTSSLPSPAPASASEEFATRLLEEEKVAVVPGTAFGDCGEGFVRCSYATSMTLLEEAMKRMAAFTSRVAANRRRRLAPRCRRGEALSSPVYPLAFKPDLTEAAERWEAYLAGACSIGPSSALRRPAGRRSLPPGQVTTANGLSQTWKTFWTGCWKRRRIHTTGGKPSPLSIPARSRCHRGLLRGRIAVAPGVWRYQLGGALS